MARTKKPVEVKEEVKEVVEVKETEVVAEKPVKKTRTRKAAVKTEEAAEKAPVKRATRKTTSKAQVEVFVQWFGKEVTEKEIVEKIQNIWTVEMGKKITELKDLKVYIKPEENMAHYVINGEVTGHIEV